MEVKTNYVLKTENAFELKALTCPGLLEVIPWISK